MSSRTSLIVALVLVALALVVVSPAVRGQSAGPAAATSPANATQPGDANAAKPDEPVVSVGDRKLMRSELETALANPNIPAYQRDAYKDRLLTEATYRLLQIQTCKNMPADEEQLRKEIERIRAELALDKWVREATTPQKLDAYVAEHAQFFDGTKVHFSQILIACPLYASTADQKAKAQEAEQLRKRLEAGQVTFEEAARTISTHESKKVGGDMGVTEFIDPSRPDVDMVMAIATFSTPKDQISQVVRSTQGFHLFKVTEIVPGDGKVKNWQDPKSGQTVPATAVAGVAIRAAIQNEIMWSAAKQLNVTNHEK